MTSPIVRRSVGVFLATALAVNLGWAADTKRAPTPSSSRGTITPAQRPGTPRTGAARGPLPDPTLLDGSKHPAEKKSEYGMIGDFELPGDENARDGRVGGGQNQNQNQQQQQQQQQGGGGMGLPQSGGGPQSAQTAAKSGEQAIEQQANAQSGGGQQNADAAGKEIPGGGDPNAQAQGMQVAQLDGESSGQQDAAGAGEKPSAVAIGDSAMQIQTASAASAVGAQQQQVQGNTQHHEKGTGTGGRPPTGVQGNNRVERGRTIPSGL